MNRLKKNLAALAILIGATIGAGVFALPYVTQSSGWVLMLVYAILLGGIMAFSHRVYLEALEFRGGHGSFVGMAREHGGKIFYAACLLVTFLNIILALLIYLVLGGGFIKTISGLSFNQAVLVFWFLVSLPLLFRKETFLEIEEWGTLFVALLLLIVAGNLNSGNLHIPAVNPAQWFLPLGPVIFALAGWTGIEPLSRLMRDANSKRKIIFWAMAVILFLYIAFVLGALSSTSQITPDFVSGLSSGGAIVLMATVGILAIWRSHLALGDEMRNSINNFHWGRNTGLYLAVFVPILLVFMGFNNLIGLIEVAGGVSLSLQYLLILNLSRKVLKPKGAKFALMYICELLFVVVTGYTIYKFLI